MSVPDGLLVLLRDEAKHGYQLAADFADRTAGRWTLNTGQVYTTLDRLTRDGFVEPDGTVDPDDARRRRYRLTEEGRTRAERWLAEAPPEASGRDDLVLRVLLSAAVDPAAALTVIDAQRSTLLDRLQSVRRAGRSATDSRTADDRTADSRTADGRSTKGRSTDSRTADGRSGAVPSGDVLISRMARDAAAVRIEADLRWLDLCEERIGSHRPEGGAS